MTLAGPLWSAQQREWLQALGHDVPVLATDAAAPTPTTAATAGPGAATAVLPGDALAPPLLQALARAAGRPVGDPDFLRAVPDLATLRGSPAARRALWPRLRALRPRGMR